MTPACRLPDSPTWWGRPLRQAQGRPLRQAQGRFSSLPIAGASCQQPKQVWDSATWWGRLSSLPIVGASRQQPKQVWDSATWWGRLSSLPIVGASCQQPKQVWDSATLFALRAGLPNSVGQAFQPADCWGLLPTAQTSLGLRYPLRTESRTPQLSGAGPFDRLRAGFPACRLLGPPANSPNKFGTPLLTNSQFRLLYR